MVVPGTSEGISGLMKPRGPDFADGMRQLCRYFSLVKMSDKVAQTELVGTAGIKTALGASAGEGSKSVHGTRGTNSPPGRRCNQLGGGG